MNLFGFDDYRSYLRQTLGDGQRNGRRQKLADSLGCQPAHLSQVLKEKSHLSVEHAFGVNKFLNHTKHEAEYFLFILQAGRAGTSEAEIYFRNKAAQVKEDSLDIKSRISSPKQELSPLEQSTYYGHYLFAMAHVASSLPQIKTIEDISTRLNVESESVVKVVDFLLETGLLTRGSDGLTTGPGHTHLGAESLHNRSHQANLRMAALKRLDQGIQNSNLHYGVYYTLSEADALLLKDRILALIDENLKIVGPSNEEVMYCNVIDFFRVIS